MFYLILAIVCSAGVFVVMRLFDRFHLDNHQALSWNYLVASAFGFLTCGQSISLSGLVAEPWFKLSFLTGFWFIFTYLLMARSSQQSGVTVTSLSSKLSVVLPTLAGVLLFHEEISLTSGIGVLLALIALVLVIGGRKEGEKGKNKEAVTGKRRWLLVLLPVLIFFGTGIGDIFMKLTEQANHADDMTFMIAFIYFIALVFGMVIVIYDLVTGKSKWSWKSALGGLALGLVNFFSTSSIYKSMRVFDNVVLFPIYNIGVVSLTALIGFFFFKEKLTWKNYLGLAIAIVAVYLITFRP